MPIFYRGAGLGTFWHETDAQVTGFTPHHAAGRSCVETITHHIARGTTISPFVSLSRSYAVARDYALSGRGQASERNPAFVYEILINEHDGFQTKLVDPLIEIAKHLSSPYEQTTYHHDGCMKFLKGIVDPIRNSSLLNAPTEFAPNNNTTPRPPLRTMELEAIVRAIRDAEILVEGNINSIQVQRKINVYPQ